MGGIDPDGAEIEGRGPKIELLLDTGVGGIPVIENGFGMDAHGLLCCEGIPRPSNCPWEPMGWFKGMPCGIIPTKKI